MHERAGRGDVRVHAQHVLLSSGSAAGFRMVYATRCREGHLREGRTRVEVDGDEFQVGGREERGEGIRVRVKGDPCEGVAVMGSRLQKIT